MPVVIDLHAADVDVLCATPLRLSEARHRLGKTGGMNGFTVDVHVIGAELAPAPGLRQADRVEDIERDAGPRGRASHLPLARQRPLRVRPCKASSLSD